MSSACGFRWAQGAREKYAARYPGSCGSDAKPIAAPTVFPASHAIGDAEAKHTAVLEVIARGLADVRSCYEDAVVGWREAEGKVVIRFIVATNGSVPVAEIAQDSIHVAPLNCCILEVVKRWRFSPPEDDGIIVITYPMFLHAGRDVPLLTTELSAASGPSSTKPAAGK